MCSCGTSFLLSTPVIYAFLFFIHESLPNAKVGNVSDGITSRKNEMIDEKEQDWKKEIRKQREAKEEKTCLDLSFWFLINL